MASGTIPADTVARVTADSTSHAQIAAEGAQGGLRLVVIVKGGSEIGLWVAGWGPRGAREQVVQQWKEGFIWGCEERCRSAKST